jgi:uncharacterized membrane protein YdbT with pleckstrin-like domain
MDFLRGLLLGTGMLAFCVGLIWICQGTGILHWPETSYMIGDKKWAINGGIAAAIGAVAMYFGRPQ